MTSFSKRTNWQSASNPFSNAVLRRQSQKRPFLDLTQSNPTRCGFKFYSRDFIEPLADIAGLNYEPDPHGLLKAREAIAGYYAQKKISVRPEAIFLTAGTSEAYSFIFRLLCNPGDTVLAPAPSYPLFDYLSDLNDIRLNKSGDPTRDHFRAAILVNPNNPTGRFVSTEDLRLWNECCRKNSAVLISDEVFLDYDFYDKGRSLAGNEEVLTFTLSGISKILGLPQMKLAWLIVSGPEDLKKEALRRLELIADTYLSVSTPAQHALPLWLNQKDKIISEIKQRVYTNFLFLKKAVEGSEWAISDSEGGWYAVLTHAHCADDEAFALEILEKKDVLVHPGYFYDFESGNHFVVSLLPEPAVFQEGIAKILQKNYNESP